MKLLDVFCGLGGVSDGFALEGFDVTGIDIEDMPTKGYKHRFIRADIRDLKGEDYQGYDVIWGSPPCRDYSRIGDVYGHNWKNPPDPKGQGLKTVKEFLRFVQEAKPTYWIMENVYGLTKYLDLPNEFVTYISIGKNGQGKKHAFWGNFPPFLIPQDLTKRIAYHVIAPNGVDRWMREYKEGKIVNIQGKLRKWERARIPECVSRAFARAIREALEEKQVLEVSA